MISNNISIRVEQGPIQAPPSSRSTIPGADFEQPYAWGEDQVNVKGASKDPAAHLVKAEITRLEPAQGRTISSRVALTAVAPGPLGSVLHQVTFDAEGARSALKELKHPQQEAGAQQISLTAPANPKQGDCPMFQEGSVEFLGTAIAQSVHGDRYLLQPARNDKTTDPCLHEESPVPHMTKLEDGIPHAMNAAEKMEFAQNIASALLSRKDVPEPAAERILGDVGLALANDQTIDVSGNAVGTAYTDGERLMVDRSTGEVNKYVDHGQIGASLWDGFKQAEEAVGKPIDVALFDACLMAPNPGEDPKPEAHGDDFNAFYSPAEGLRLFGDHESALPDTKPPASPAPKESLNAFYDPADAKLFEHDSYPLPDLNLDSHYPQTHYSTVMMGHDGPSRDIRTGQVTPEEKAAFAQDLAGSRLVKDANTVQPGASLLTPGIHQSVQRSESLLSPE